MTVGRYHEVPRRTADRDLSRRRDRALWIALVLNGGFMVAELVGGLVFSSLALLADAAHMLSDAAGLAIALVAQRLVDRPASVRHTYGMQRAEVLGAQANGVLLLATAGWILFEGARRIGDPPDVAGTGVLIVAVLGLAVNVGSAVMLARASGRSLNMRGAYTHMLADAAGSVGVIVAAVAVIAFGANWVDPAASIIIGLLVIRTSWGLLRDTTHVLLEGAPDSIDAAEVEQWLGMAAGVASVHHIHLWHLTSETTALSAHVVLEGRPSLHQAQAHGDILKDQLAERFAIAHTTLELECHQCEPEPADVVSAVEPPQPQGVERD
ncbi:MAG TPA: cation diffusion facilitator family transporter [Euzebyales bacterium]